MTDSQIDGIQVLNHTDLVEYSHNISTVAGITFALNNLFKSSANLTWSVDWDFSVSGTRAQSQFPADSTAHISENCNYSLDHTSSGVPDPFIYLLREINFFAFVSGLYLSGVPSIKVHDRKATNHIPRAFTTTVSGYIEQYETNYRFLGAAVAASIVTLLGVLPVYWGFWQLGRKVALGPIEIANAFDAPVFDGATAKNGDIDDLLDEVGKTRVKYGWLASLSSRQYQLGFAEPEIIESVEKIRTERFGNTVVQ